MTPERVLELKAEATALKQAAGIKQSAALAQIAQREGFSSWPVLMAAAGGADLVREVRHEQAWDNPTEARIRRGLRKAERMQRYGSAA